MTWDEDRWLLPRRQTEYPTWDLVSEATLHGRREATYLVLATILLVTLTPLLWLGTSHVIDLGTVLATWFPELELPIAMQLPFGVVPFALGLIAVLLACELYGRRRAAALVGVGLGASLALIGLAVWLDHASPELALAFVACFLLGHVASLVVFDALRRRMGGRHVWLRTVAAALVAPIGWAAFAAVAALTPGVNVIGVAIGSAIYTAACVVVGALPLVIAARALSLFLRVARHEAPARDPNVTEPVRRLEPALIVDVEQEIPARRRPARTPAKPYSNAELRFFLDGEELAESPRSRS